MCEKINPTYFGALDIYVKPAVPMYARPGVSRQIYTRYFHVLNEYTAGVKPIGFRGLCMELKILYPGGIYQGYDSPFPAVCYHLTLYQTKGRVNQATF